MLQAFVDRDNFALFNNEALLHAYARNAPRVGVALAKLLDTLFVVREGFSKDPEFNHLIRPSLDSGACVQVVSPSNFIELMGVYCGEAEPIATLVSEVGQVVGTSGYAL